jgi:hypothetical protein
MLNRPAASTVVRIRTPLKRSRSRRVLWDALRFIPPGRLDRRPVTVCRTFTCAVRERLDAIVAPDGVVAIFGDNSI